MKCKVRKSSQGLFSYALAAIIILITGFPSFLARWPGRRIFSVFDDIGGAGFSGAIRYSGYIGAYGVTSSGPASAGIFNKGGNQ